MRAKRASIFAAVLSLAIAAPIGVAAGTTSASPATTYYLALGDSLSTGGGATPGSGYVDDVYAHEQAIIPGLQLENLGCAGDSTTEDDPRRKLHQLHDGKPARRCGGVPGFPRRSGEVRDHRRRRRRRQWMCPQRCHQQHVRPEGTASGCDEHADDLGGPASGRRHVPIVGMVYYDPWLAFYLNGTSGQQAATASLGLLHQLNSELRGAYKQYQARIAPVQKDFDTWDMALTGSFNGQTLPQDVANICNWTHMCDPTNPTNHTNDTGHSVLATAFEARLKLVR